MGAEQQQHDLEWLKGALQTAISIEHSTLPLYLSAMFSLRVQNYTAYNLIRSVVMEEMVHMSIACNTLAAIGGTPRIRDLDPHFPSQGLPGGVEPDIHARLAKLSREQLKMFMRVEAPEFLLTDEQQHESYPSIADFYGAVVQAIEGSADAIREAIKETAAGGEHANQIGDNIGFNTITYEDGVDPLPQVFAGIEEILEQGEGSPSLHLHAGAGSEGEESHYCKFAELYYGHTYSEPAAGVDLNRETEPEYFRGYPVPFPDVINTLAVPADGYEALLAEDPNAAEAEKGLNTFDDAYTGVMSNLDEVWNGPIETSWPTLGKAVEGMGFLRVPANFMVTVTEIPPDAIAKLPQLYPEEYEQMAALTDLDAPVFYGPRFVNRNSGA